MKDINEGDREKKEKLFHGNNIKGFSTIQKYKIFGLFFCLGLFNNLTVIIVSTGKYLIANELELTKNSLIYVSSPIIFCTVTRVINAKFFLKISYKKRIYFLCFWMMLGYITMFLIFLLYDAVLSEKNYLFLLLSLLPCFFLVSSYAFGEPAIISYLRFFPKTLIAGWSSGTGLSGIFGASLNYITQLKGRFSLKYLYLILSISGPLSLFMFMLSFRILKDKECHNEVDKSLPLIPYEKNEDNDKNNDEDYTNKINDKNDDNDNNKRYYSNKNNNNDKSDWKEIKEKVMEKMNEDNKILSYENFKKIMSMCGRLIINLCIIYFFLFFCVDCVLVRICDKVDIDILPKGCSSNGHTYRKGKYEFISLFFQVGMFIGKAFIKLVRKIQPIEIFTSIILIVNIIYITEYYNGFMHWGNFIWITFILGFFGGGTYSGVFYTILNSDTVQENYKELTVNLVILFDDFGTFLAGIGGSFTLYYWLDSQDPFKGKQIQPKYCEP